jgi:hypothetical protein
MANSNNSTSLYSFVGNTVVSKNDFTTLYNTTPGNVVNANVPDRNFTTLYTKQTEIRPTYAYGNSNVEAFLNVGSDTGGNQVQNIVMYGNLHVGDQSYLGNVGNVHITGGNLNYILQTDGAGNLNWTPLPGSQGNITTYTHFDVGSTGNDQSFTNANLIVFANSNSMAVFKNGINIEPSQYSISGNVLTINIPLNTGDTIDVLPSSAGGGGGSPPGGNLTEVQYNGGSTFSGNASFTFDQPNATLNVTNISSNTLAVNEIETSNITVLGNLSVNHHSNLGSVSNITITGGTANYVLKTDGLGNLSWTAQTGGNGGGNTNPAGSNTYVQYNDNGNFGASANFTFDSSTNTLTATNIVGNVANANYAAYSGIANSATTAGTSVGANLANYAINVTGNSQSNITSLGQLYNLSVGYSGNVDFTNTSNVSLGSVSNLHITGGSGGQYLTTNGSGVLQWQTVTVSNANSATYATELYDPSSGGSAFIGGDGSLYVAGPNSTAIITGSGNVMIGTNYVYPTGYTNKWNFTTTGNLVLPGNTFAVNYANGTQVSFNNVANANYANYAGNAFSVSGSNVTGTVANANNASYATTVIGASQSNITSLGTLTSLTVSGNITTGNISSTGKSNIANTNFTKFQETVIGGGSVSGTITPDASAGTIYTYTLTGNITLNSLANVTTGTSMTLRLTQDGTGNRTLTSTMKFAGGSKTLSTAASATDIISVFYDGASYYAVLSKGYV